MPRMMMWLLIAAVLLAGCVNNKDEKLTTLDIPPAGVRIGEPLKWRTLASFTFAEDAPKLRPGIVVGEFTKDKSDDVLLIDWMGDTEIISADGKRRKVDAEIWPVIFEFTAWDYNRDGVCELVPANYGFVWIKDKEGTIDYYGLKLDYFSTDPDFRETSSLQPAQRGRWTPIFDTKANICIQLSSGDSDGVAVRGDYDGDGQYDLAVEEAGLIENIRVYAGVGQRLGEWEPQMKPTHVMAGDTDGDGRDEFLCMEGSRIAVYAWKQERRDIQGWPLGEYPCCAADVTGDGKAEIIGAICELESPAGRDSQSAARLIVYDHLQRIRIALAPETDPDKLKEIEENTKRMTDEELAEFKATRLAERVAEIEQIQLELAAAIAPYTHPHGGIFDIASGAFTPLQFPKDEIYPYNMFHCRPGEIMAADLDRDGQREIIAKATVGSALFIFNAAGELTYYEEFGQAAAKMDVAHTKDGDMLVVLLEDKVIAYP